MSSESSQTEFEFGKLRESIEREFGPSLAMEFLIEHGEKLTRVIVGSIRTDLLYSILKIARNHSETVRIHSIDSPLIHIQTSQIDSKEALKIRLIQTKQKSCIEFSKRSGYLEWEYHLIVDILGILASQEKAPSPYERLKDLGVDVYIPKEEEKHTAFDSIFGYESVKREVMESIVFPSQNPNILDQISALTRKIPQKNKPRAVLLEGDPGVGKTTMARAVSCLCQIPMIYIPLESILSKYYGESSQNLAKVFDLAKELPSSLLFLDEIDTFAGDRGGGMFEATRTLLSVLLRKIDGFQSHSGSIFIGATNRKNDLDRALLSRFNKSIAFPLPNEEERGAILSGYAIQLNPEEVLVLAREMESFSGRSIRDFCDRVERRWALETISKENELSPPPFSAYREILDTLRN
jgi:ATP-dependent Zn protease